MSYWSELNENNIVIRTIVCDNNDLNGDEGYQWIMENIGGKWIKTSYNTFANTHSMGKEPFRKNFGRVGYYYDEQRDAFIPPKPNESFILNEETCLWEAPVPYPNDGENYIWDEPSTSWLLLPPSN